LRLRFSDFLAILALSWRLGGLQLLMSANQQAETTSLRYIIPCATIRETNTSEYC
jgi:hypothetical protein